MNFTNRMSKTLLFIFAFLSVASLSAQDLPYVEKTFYFKVSDEYPIEFPTTRTDQVDVPQQLEFFIPFEEEYGAKIVRSFFFSFHRPLLRTFKVVIEKEEQSEEFMKRMRDRQEIQYIERVPRIFLFGNAEASTAITSDPYEGDQWYLEHTKVQDAWAEGATGKKRTVAVVDNGFDLKHTDFDPNLWMKPFDVAHQDDDPSIVNTGVLHHHGTHIAGIIGAHTGNSHGMASVSFDSKIIPIKASLDATPHVVGDGWTLEMGFEGLEAAITYGANIINLSWGYQYDSFTGAETIAHADTSDIIIVAAAGNHKSDVEVYPAAFPSVIGVGAITASNTKWSGSNFGEWVDIAAPGVEILSAVPNNNFKEHEGTSMAAPIVAGICALAWSIDTSLPAQTIKECVLNSADNIDGALDQYAGLLGNGLVNALAAVQCVIESSRVQVVEEEDIIEAFSIAPNPMRNTAVIDFELNRGAKVLLQIYYSGYLRGVTQEVIPLSRWEGGTHSVKFTRRGRMPAGLYYARLVADHDVEVIKFSIR